MADFLSDFMSTPVGTGVIAAIQFAIWASVVYLTIRCVRALSPNGRWKLVKIALTILFLPLVLVWKFATAGSDCGCCCDEDD
jgi:hypothetical protein